MTSEAFSAGRPSLEVLDAVLAAGVRLVQLREKDKSKAELEELAHVFRQKTREAGCLLIVNDHVDIALAVEADGVHLGQGDLPVAEAKATAPDLLVGVSCHNAEQAVQAQAGGADYVNIGPIFPTATKPGHDRFLGAFAILQIAPKLTISYTCMGGITEENIDEVLAVGARIVAVVSAVTAAPDIEAAARALRERIIRTRGG
ncbi:MAG: thiamine phosphate synthase [Deltaproteobacteria bacterium]|nr:thiamine phosphate synthase [Deltaproteobacteria bacterium]